MCRVASDLPQCVWREGSSKSECVSGRCVYPYRHTHVSTRLSLKERLCSFRGMCASTLVSELNGVRVSAVPVCNTALMTAQVNREQGNHVARGNKAKSMQERRAFDIDSSPALPFHSCTRRKRSGRSPRETFPMRSFQERTAEPV